jgi:glycerol-3-phosphate cytidylyltransferase
MATMPDPRVNIAASGASDQIQRAERAVRTAASASEWSNQEGAMDVASKTVITFGTFDVFHVGHVRVLNRSAALGDRLVVGVSSDNLNFAKKGRNPVFSQDERLEIVANVKAVDAVFIEESLEQKRDYVLEHKADILVMGDDWQGKFDFLSDICQVVYLPRTPSVSTTAIIEQIVGSS